MALRLQQGGGHGGVAHDEQGGRARAESVTDEAFSELEEAMKAGGIATVAQAHEFLRQRGVHYSHPESAWEGS